ncbi:MAG: DUF5596 domain-containing protein [Oscillospiraceae bacterium]|nr:DUF5596 domain-containing protein [Oscillospiraceae bacterium]
MNIEQMKTELGMKSVPGCFFDIYTEIAESYEKRAEVILSDEYVRRTLSENYALLPYIDTVVEAAGKVRGNNALRLLVCILENWVRNGGNPGDKEYDAPTGVGLEYDFFHLFAAIPTIPESVNFLRNRNVPEDIIAATLREYDYCFEMRLQSTGRIDFDRGRLSWIRKIIHNKMIRVDRLKFELPTTRVNGIKAYKNKEGDILVLADGLHIHKSGHIVGSIGCEDETGSFFAEIEETETEIIGHIITDGEVAREKSSFSKDEWELCLSKEDPVIPVHIPKEGDFGSDTIESTYNRLFEVMENCFSDMPYKAVHCHTWMMSRDLRKVLKPTSNILAFRDKYIHYPCRSDGTWVFNFVFMGEGGLSDIENLSEKTSLQRNVKELYKNGGAIYDDCGFFLKI